MHVHHLISYIIYSYVAVQDTDLESLKTLMEEFDAQVSSSNKPIDFEQKYKLWNSRSISDGESAISTSGSWDGKGKAASSIGGGCGYQTMKRGFHLPPMSDRGSDRVQQLLLGNEGSKVFNSRQKEETGPADTASRVQMWMQQRSRDKDKKNDILETHNVHQSNLVCNIILKRCVAV